MKLKEINALLEHLKTDASFRSRFFDDPAAAATELDITLTTSEVQAFQAMDHDHDKLEKHVLHWVVIGGGGGSDGPSTGGGGF